MPVNLFQASIKYRIINLAQPLANQLQIVRIAFPVLRFISPTCFNAIIKYKLKMRNKIRMRRGTRITLANITKINKTPR